MSRNATPDTIGRFKVIRVLGEGAQSVVYLAQDPHLRREVAIKTVHLDGGEDHFSRTHALIDEARTVSTLQHPNIVPIFEAGEHDGNPYLVFEYVAGSDLASLIAKQAPLAESRAVELAVQILDAVAYAHQHNIIHRDLKPSNILLTGDGVPRVMDFGIATRISGAGVADRELMLFGTPGFMAPEYITDQIVGPKLDIFAIGMILYQMLTGVPAVQGSDAREVLERIVHGSIEPPSAKKRGVDEKLDDIVLKALATDPAKRYDSAQDMKAALAAYLEPDTAPAAIVSGGTLDFLLRRMRHKSDFPALSESISAINRIASSESEGVTQLSNAVLKDVALTSKLLKVVNAACYAQYGGGTISTVSRAVVTLGFDAVRNITLTLMLFEHLQNKENAAHLKDEFVRSLYAALIARSLTHRVGLRNAEEGFICALFHSLGKMLCMFYLMEEVDEVNRLTAQKSMAEESAAVATLGMSYADIGIGVARAWNFPGLILHSMRSLPGEKVKKPTSDPERLNVLSSFAHDIGRMSTMEAGQEKTKALLTLTRRFGSALDVSESAIETIARDAAAEFADFATTLQLDLRQSQVGQKLLKSAGQTEAATTALLATQETKTGADGLNLEQSRMIELGPSELHEDAQGILTQGIQDISASLVEGRSLNDIMRMIMETMYTSIGFDHVLLCIRDPKTNQMTARSGFGPDISGIVRAFRFPLAFAPDVFHACMKNNVDIIIEDIDDPKIESRIPAWYRTAVSARTFVLFPIVIKNNPIALIYADKGKAGAIKLPERELGLLRVLRNQAVLAIKSQS